jgi:hypothetical protein
MSIDSAAPTSRRGYLSRAELAQYANITITDTAEADDRISQAEELIDAYVGPQNKFLQTQLTGRAITGGSLSITLQTNQQNIYEADYFSLCEIELLGGTGAGQRRKCTSSTKAGVLTIDSAWTTTPDSTTFYIIYQLGKFPRQQDVKYYSEQSPNTYYKLIPENIKRAIAAQVAYAIEMGDSFFAGDETDKTEERIGDYSYVKAERSGGVAKLIAPRAKILLRGYINRTGQIMV